MAMPMPDENVLPSYQKDDHDYAEAMSSGTLFQICGTAAKKTLPQTVGN